MQLARPAIALDSRTFGKGRRWQLELAPLRGSPSSDLRLFATTFLAGFLFVSILIG